MKRPAGRHARAGLRSVVAAVLGVLAGVLTAVLGSWSLAPALFWVVTALVYVVTTWVAVARMDAAQTAHWATQEDPTAGVADVLLLGASLASLAGVALLLVSVDSGDEVAAAALGTASVVASWVTVRTVCTLRYAALYYAGEEGGIDFDQRLRPAYADFAYLGFTIGMTYQVSDTSVSDPVIRRAVLRHAVISYVLGAVVLAITINLVGNLAR